jgi:tRNA(Ser,Leu) C12 N-acetylase TAN1
MADANILITYEPNHAASATAEVESLLKEMKQKALFLKSVVDGVFLLRVTKPSEFIKKLSAFCKKEPSKFEYTFSWAPVGKWCASSLNEMVKTVSLMGKKIKQNEKWKLELKKRLYEKYSTPELIRKLTENIDRPNVDLKKPQKIIKVDILKNKAAITLLDKDELLTISRK